MRYLLLLFLIVLPLAADAHLQDVVCLGQHERTSINRNYLDNIHLLEAMLQSKTSSLPGLSTDHEVGEYPDTLYAFSRCHNGTDSSCRACITLALQEVRRACPDHKGSVFFKGNCSLRLYGDDAIVFTATERERKYFRWHFLVGISYLVSICSLVSINILDTI
ncbi:unnamed protein product [Urochloa humidicola]